MKLRGKKIGILLESDFYEKEIFYYEHRFQEEGVELHFLTRLWKQPSQTFLDMTIKFLSSAMRVLSISMMLLSKVFLLSWCHQELYLIVFAIQKIFISFHPLRFF